MDLTGFDPVAAHTILECKFMRPIDFNSKGIRNCDALAYLEWFVLFLAGFLLARCCCRFELSMK